MRKRFAILLGLCMTLPCTAYADEVPSIADLLDATESQGEPIWEEETYDMGYLPETCEAEPQNGSGTPDLQTLGVVEDGWRTYTWYSENILPGDGLYELNANGRWTDPDGFVRDGEGYIAVASPWGVDPIGTVIDTPWGMARVYDVCESGRYDVYTGW